MKVITDSARIRRAIKKSSYSGMLTALDVPITLIEYEKNEYLCSPFRFGELFQIVISGEINIYLIRDDGTRHALSGNNNREYILGDMEFFFSQKNSIYAEANSPVRSLAIDMAKNREYLMDNAPFLRLLGHSLSDKMAALTDLSASPSTLKDRVLTFMEYNCDDGVLKGVEKAAFHLHCSPRQLQRILNRLTGEGLIEKTGKGRYRRL